MREDSGWEDERDKERDNERDEEVQENFSVPDKDLEDIEVVITASRNFPALTQFSSCRRNLSSVDAIVQPQKKFCTP